MTAPQSETTAVEHFFDATLGWRADAPGRARRALAGAVLALAISSPALADYGAPEQVVLRWSGAITPVAGGMTVYVFAGPTVQVTIPAGQRRIIRGSATAALGLSGAGPQSVHIGLCYQLQGGGSVSTFGLASHIYQDMDNVRRLYAINDVVNLGGGTYDVGYCVYNPGALGVTNIDSSTGFIIVTPT